MGLYVFTFEGHPQVLGVDYHDGNENDHFIVRNMDI